MVTNTFYDIVGSIADLYRRLTGKERLNIFEQQVLAGLEQGVAPGRTQQAREWYRDQAKLITRVPKEEIFRDIKRFEAAPRAGQMYTFAYMPKYHETLPYHDRMPLVIPFDRIPNGFAAINLHYLPLPARAALMDALYTLASDEDMTEETKINISYEMIRGLIRFKFAKPCIKKYLYGHVQSRFVKINSSEWDVALFLPTEQFAQGKGMPNVMSKAQAQQDSLGKARKP